MTTINASTAKLTLVFKPGQLPAIDPARPEFSIVLGTHRIAGQVNAKAARKLAVHQGGAVLQGRLVEERGELVLVEAGFQFIEPKPVETSEATS
jgi:hypothetical protein